MRSRVLKIKLNCRYMRKLLAGRILFLERSLNELKQSTITKSIIASLNWDFRVLMSESVHKNRGIVLLQILILRSVAGHLANRVSVSHFITTSFSTNVAETTDSFLSR